MRIKRALVAFLLAAGMVSLPQIAAAEEAPSGTTSTEQTDQNTSGGQDSPTLTNSNTPPPADLDDTPTDQSGLGNPADSPSLPANPQPATSGNENSNDSDPAPSDSDPAPSDSDPAPDNPEIVFSAAVYQGQSGDRIRQFQQQFKAKLPQYGDFEVTGTYDDATSGQIRNFQKDNDLHASGVVDLKTSFLLRKSGVNVWVLPELNRDKALSVGNVGTEVGILQSWLLYMIPDQCIINNIDYIFGNQTRGCVKALQNKLGLRAHGAYDGTVAQKAIDTFDSKIVIAPVPDFAPLHTPNNIYKGAYGANVGTLQSFLSYYFPQFYTSKVDSSFWNGTYSALYSFQQVHGISPDGVFGSLSTRVAREYGLDAWIIAPVKTNWTIVAGQHGHEIVMTQKWLVKTFPQHCSFIPDGWYGNMTKTCVNAIRADFGLAQTGYIDSQLSKKLVEAGAQITVGEMPEPTKSFHVGPMYPGASGSAVTTVQTGLNKYFPELSGFNPDGYYGGLTKSAVRGFQEKFDITPDGAIGAWTAGRMRAQGIPIWVINPTTVGEVLRPGSASPTVANVKLMLNYLYPDICSLDGSNTYDSATSNCVYKAQARLGISNPDGTVGSLTAKALRAKGMPINFVGYQAPWGYLQPTDRITPLGGQTNTLSWGMNGVKVRIVQQRLGIWGTYTLASVDSRFQNAVRNFQRRAGIYADGVVGPTTWNAMRTGYSWYVDQYQATPIGIEANRSQRIEAMVGYALAQRGSSYTWGGAGPYSLGFDCSGLALQSLYAGGMDPQPINVVKHGWPSYRTSRELYAYSGFKHYPLSQRQRGDLIFYKSGGTIVHVAIYLGGDQVMHTNWMGRPARVQHFLLNYGWANTVGDVVRPFP